MQREYIQTNKQEIREDIRLHDTMLTKVVWNYQDRSVFFELTNWEWGGEGHLSLEGAVCMEGSALALCADVESPIYINYFMADDQCTVSDMFARSVQYGDTIDRGAELPDTEPYFCVAFGTNMGDRLRFVVSKVIWETDD